MLSLGPIDGEVTMVHLVDHDVLPGTPHVPVTLPPCRVGIIHIDNDSFLAIDGDSLGKDARRSHPVDHKLVGLALLVALGCSRPNGIGSQGHRQRIVVEHHTAFGIGRCK